MEVKFTMDAIMEVIGKIDFEKIISVVKEVIAWIEKSGIVDKIIEAVKGLIANIA